MKEYQLRQLFEDVLASRGIIDSILVDKLIQIYQQGIKNERLHLSSDAGDERE